MKEQLQINIYRKMKMKNIITTIAIAVSILIIDFLIRVYNDFFSRFSLQDAYNFFGIIAAIASPIAVYFVIKTFKEQKRSNDINIEKNRGDFYLKQLNEIKRVDDEFQSALQKFKTLKDKVKELQTTSDKNIILEEIREVILGNSGILLYTITLLEISLYYFQKRDASKSNLFFLCYFYKVQYVDGINFIELSEITKYMNAEDENSITILKKLNNRKEKLDISFDELTEFYGENSN